MSQPAIRVSMIVLNHNGADVLEHCLVSLSAAMADDDELIVVDNASSDESREYAREFCAARSERRCVLRTRNNYIFGLNDGLAVARGRFVGFINNDNVFEPDAVDCMVRRF